MLGQPEDGMLDDGELCGMNENESPQEEPPPAHARQAAGENFNSDEDDDNEEDDDDTTVRTPYIATLISPQI